MSCGGWNCTIWNGEIAGADDVSVSAAGIFATVFPIFLPQYRDVLLVFNILYIPFFFFFFLFRAFGNFFFWWGGFNCLLFFFFFFFFFAISCSWICIYSVGEFISCT